LLWPIARLDTSARLTELVGEETGQELVANQAKVEHVVIAIA
jgi:hypothetical protein